MELAQELFFEKLQNRKNLPYAAVELRPVFELIEKALT
jgi:hypothetical protein